MVDKLSIAIIGCGISGLAASIFIKQGGHNVTLFDKFSTPKAVGAGLVLQPSGLNVLSELGVSQQLIEQGAVIKHFVGHSRNDKIIYKMSYDSLSADCFALGIHRYHLFYSLFKKAKNLDIRIITGFLTNRLSEYRDKVSIFSNDGRAFSNFDLIIDASGANSIIRQKYASIHCNKLLSYGALWTIVERPSHYLKYDTLQQWFFRAQKGLGLIPLGKRPGSSTTDLIALHWSINNDDFVHWQRHPITRWKSEARGLCSIFDDFEVQIKDHHQFIYAKYHRTVLKKLHSDKIVFIGDAGHAMSPRLGQGANLALVDAKVLTECLANCNNLKQAIKLYDRCRKEPIAQYHRNSRLTTWMFQSNNLLIPCIRNYALKLLCNIPLTHNYLLNTLAGGKTELFKLVSQRNGI